MCGCSALEKRKSAVEGKRKKKGEREKKKREKRNNLENRGHAIHTRYLQGTTRTMSRRLVRGGEGRTTTRKRVEPPNTLSAGC